jgi:hypothetical protein
MNYTFSWHMVNMDDVHCSNFCMSLFLSIRMTKTIHHKNMWQVNSFDTPGQLSSRVERSSRFWLCFAGTWYLANPRLSLSTAWFNFPLVFVISLVLHDVYKLKRDSWSHSKNTGSEASTNSGVLSFCVSMCCLLQLQASPVAHQIWALFYNILEI